MSFFNRFELMDPFSLPFFYREASIFKHSHHPFIDDLEDEFRLALDLLNPISIPTPSPFDLPLGFFERAAHLVLSNRMEAQLRQEETKAHLQSLSDRVAELELDFFRPMRAQPVDYGRRCRWMTEIKGGEREGMDQKYKWMEAKGAGDENVKWMAGITSKGKPSSRAYMFPSSMAPRPSDAKEKMGKKQAGTSITKRVLEIEEPVNPGCIMLKKAFAKRPFGHHKGKRKEQSPQDAALLIQMSFRTHLVRRAQMLHGLREVAIAKAKLKEIRALFSNFSYRRRIENAAEERQRFSEKIIVLLLTIDALEGVDYIIRAAKRSMTMELEAMLEVVDPQHPGRLGSMKRRQFDLPAGQSISKEMALGVEDVVQMLDEERIRQR